MNDPDPIWVRCHQSVTVNRSDYDLFERMHWLCFHLEFEHQADPDDPCANPSCPWWQIHVFRGKLIERGYDPQNVLGAAVKVRWDL